jgi:hypothetical protein
MSTSSRFWLLTCIVLAISSCSAFGQAANDLMSITRADLTVGARPIPVTAQAQGRIRGESNSVLTALFGGNGLAATCGDTLADVGTSSTSATQGSAVGTFLIRFEANGPTIE